MVRPPVFAQKHGGGCDCLHHVLHRILHHFLQRAVWTVVLGAGLVVGTPLGHRLAFAQTPTNPDAAAVPDTLDKDYSAELPRIPAKSPMEALAEIEVLSGFDVQLIAAEPLVTDPVAFAFDARGRLFVVEMRDYSEQATEHLGRVALLEDRDGDGVMDYRTTFVEGLSWPTAIWPWRDGVLVAEPPRITWYRDTNGDNQSDTSEDWFNGFARGNVQGLVNSLRWGADGMIHGATSSSGADVEMLEVDARNASVSGTRVNLGRRDFAIDPINKTLHPESGGGQHGLSFNRWGDKFITSNSDHLQQVIDLDEWLANNNTTVPMPSSRRSIAVDGPQAEVFRASPIEPWRIVRTRLRVSGVTPGIVEGGGRAAGYFTGATGTWIVDHEFGFGRTGFDTALVCDVGSNLIHRKQLTDEGLFWSGQRIDERTELLRSRDTWFRPVQLGDGPDGAIYIADMAREVIEHPQSLPPVIKQHLDLTSGRELGRIWRLASPQTPHLPTVRLSDCSSEELIEHLQDAIPWRRLMASQLLIERGSGDRGDQLVDCAVNAPRAESQLLALYVAARLGLCAPSLLAQSLNDAEPRVVEHAVHLTRKLHLTSELLEELVGNSHASDARIQMALSMLAAELDVAERQQLLAPMLSKVTDPLVRGTVAAAAGDTSWQLLSEAIQLEIPNENLGAWLKLWLPTWINRIRTDAELVAWLRSQLVPTNDHLSIWIDSICSSTSHSEATQILDVLDDHSRLQLVKWIDGQLNKHQLLSDTLPDESSLRQMQWLGLLPTATQAQWLESLFDPKFTDLLQTRAMRALAWGNFPELGNHFVTEFSTMTPAVQREALRLMLARADTTEQLASALEHGQIVRSQVPPEMKQQMLTVSEKQLAERFAKLFNNVSPDRAAVIEQYTQAIEALGSATTDVTAGRQVFERACAQCHRIGDVGNDVGPPLRQLGSKSPQQLLETILDPNREVDPKYASYTVLLEDGRVVAGIIQDESTSQLILVEAGGTRQTLARGDIEQLKSSGVSFMPVGLEEQVSVEQMSNLIEFLRSR